MKRLGDGLMLAFPSAHSALRCAATMQRCIDDRNRGGGPQMGLRIGINAGEVVAAENDYFGTPVVVAKRLCDRAGPGQTLVSGIARALVGSRGGHRFVGRGALSLKGFSDPVAAFEVDWRSPATDSEGGRADSSETRGPADETEREVPPLPVALSSEAESWGGFRNWRCSATSFGGRRPGSSGSP